MGENKNFDDLFNDFFNKKNKKDEDIQKFIDDAIKMFDMFKNLKLDDEVKEFIPFDLDDDLGKPDKVEYYNEDNMYYEKSIWHTSKGDIVKVVISDEPPMKNGPKKEKTLQEQLDEAIANEEYEKAAIIRDKMIKPKRTRRTKK